MQSWLFPPRRWLPCLLLLAALQPLPGRAEDGNELAAHLGDAQVSLAQGLKLARSKGRPVAARYVVQDDHLLLAVVAVTGRDTVQLMFDPADGALRRTDGITDPVNIKKMRKAADATAGAKVTLEAAIDAAEQDSSDSRAVTIQPALVKGKAVAHVTLLRGTELTTVDQPLQ